MVSGNRRLSLGISGRILTCSILNRSGEKKECDGTVSYTCLCTIKNIQQQKRQQRNRLRTWRFVGNVGPRWLVWLVWISIAWIGHLDAIEMIQRLYDIF